MDGDWTAALSSAATRNNPRILDFFQNPEGSEMWSRWDMHDQPPDILITNYSMLNIMLMRSVENNIFESTRQWLEQDREAHVFHLVIDELHTYRGTPGTEVGYLLRAFLHRIGLTPDSPQLRVIATSASIEDDADSREYLEQFLGRDRSTFSIIRGERQTFTAPPQPLSAFGSNFSAFDSDLDHAGAVQAINNLALGLGMNSTSTGGRLLEESLASISAFQPIASQGEIENGPFRLSQLATTIFGGESQDQIAAARGLLRGCILAKMREMRLRSRSEPIFSSTMQEGFGRALILPARAALDTPLRVVRFHLWGAFIRNLDQGARIATLASLSCSTANPAERCF
jgi:hypothetical protein